MNDRLVSYDNEKDLSALVDDCMEFIVSETKRLVGQDFRDSDDPNVYVLVSQNLTMSFMLQVLMKSHLNNNVFMAFFEKQKQGAGTGNHLPVNKPDFFKGARP